MQLFFIKLKEMSLRSYHSLILVFLYVTVAYPSNGSVNDVLRPFSDTAFWKFQIYMGNGIMKIGNENGADVLEFSSLGENGMAASYNSNLVPIDGGYEYIVTLEIKTENLIPEDAKIVGAPYFIFFDKNGHPAGWYPITDLRPGPPIYIAPQNSDWITVRHHIKTPTNACEAQLVMAYAAFETWDAKSHARYKELSHDPSLRSDEQDKQNVNAEKEIILTCAFEREGSDLRNTGRATGKIFIRDMRVERGELVPVYQSSIHVPDKAIQQSIDIANNCLHNSQLSGQFKVSSGYITSGNIVPDLSFGLFGVRRLDNRDYINTMKQYWKQTAAEMDQEGRITSQRVMSQLFFPLGADEIFSFTGDLIFLAENLPLAEKAIEYVTKHGDSNGLVRLVEYGNWHISEGADWVDWYPSRMEGKTIMFQIWYIRVLRRLASLNEEFNNSLFNGGKIGSAGKAIFYRNLADKVEESVRRLYWRKDHFVTNIDFGGKIADEIWLDNQVWAIKYGIATSEQTRDIWSFIDADQLKFEGIPMRWAAFDGPIHGPNSWFGRNGAGDILARYKTGNRERGFDLIQNISRIFNRDNDIYEAYDMNGKIVQGTYGWGNYTEHSGGYIWAIVEGIFGFSFDSDNKAAASMNPNFPDEWKNADIKVIIRGTNVNVSYSHLQKRQLKFTGTGKVQNVRINLPDGTTKILLVGDRKTQTVTY
jgi:hypothetical protein